jgi:hypothetical protein
MANDWSSINCLSFSWFVKDRLWLLCRWATLEVNRGNRKCGWIK